MFKGKTNGKKGFTLIEMLTVLFIIAALATMLIPNLRKAVAKTQLAGCQSNIRNLSVMLKLYGSDNDELYPESLDKLKPDYFRIIPTCQAANTDTYSPGYTVNDERTDYTIKCKGKNHTSLGLGEDEPYFDLGTGLNP